MSTPPTLAVPERTRTEWWPVRGTHRAVMHLNLAEDRAGPWAVLVPGFTGSKEDFAALLPILAEDGIAVLAYDHLGQHESDGSEEPGDYALGLLAADLVAVVAEAARRYGRTRAPHLVGHSFGGLVAQQALVDGLRPASFVGLCTGPGALPPGRWARLPQLVDALPATDLAVIWQTMQAAAGESDRGPMADDIAEFLEHRWLGNHPLHLRQVAVTLMECPVLVESRARFDGVPITIMFGEHDDVWPLDDQRNLARRLSAPIVELADAGHSPNADSPHLLATALLRSWIRSR